MLAAIADALASALPPATARRFWDLYEATRHDLVASVPAATERLGGPDAARAKQAISRVLPERFLHPRATAVIERLRSLGRVVLFSDGDPSYQRQKAERAGIAELVDEIRVFARKEEHVAELVRDLPADIHVFIDDKTSVLAEVRRRLPRAVLLHVRQGKYGGTMADVRIDRVYADLRDLERLELADLAGRPATPPS